MIIDNSLQSNIDEILIADNLARDKKHNPSGLLSASWLFQPLRFQVMKTIGVPLKKIEPYVLGKFLRGNQVEEWLIERMKEAGVLVEAQKEVKYKKTIGFIDAVIDSNKMQFKKGHIPHEIKSVTNAKLARINKTEVDYHYKLQGCFYALAIRADYYAIDIISAEDLRVITYIFETIDLARVVDVIITRYDNAIKNWKMKKVLPEFQVNPQVKWTANPQYAPFEEKYLKMTDQEIAKVIEK